MLYADGTQETRDAVDRAFPTAQHIRELVIAHGFTPIVRIGDGENFVRGGRRIQLGYEGDVPGDVPPIDIEHATLVRAGGGWTLSLD